MKRDKLFVTLEKHGIEPKWFETREAAAAYLVEEIKGQKVAFGGSVTLEQMSLYEKLKEENEVFWHWKNPDGAARRQAELDATVYISSANGVSETGEIINIDGNGNRVANMLYGQDWVIFVVGENKVEETLEKAMWRARNVAAPLNARRLKKKTPCALGEECRCFDCSAPDRVCRVATITMEKPSPMKRMEFILVGESLGY